MLLKAFAVTSALMMAAAGAAEAQAIDKAMGGPGNPAHGKVLFEQRCAICHQPQKGGKNGVGPALYGAYGAGAAKRPTGFAYSDKLKKSTIVWTPVTLNQWIQKPASLVPGVKMVLPPVTAPQDRADIIAYLRTQTTTPGPAPAPAPATPGKAPAKKS